MNECPLCERKTHARWCCGIELSAERRWAMTPGRIKAVHVLAHTIKGLDGETYRLRLQRIGVETSKDFTRKQFEQFMRELRALPDAGQGKRVAACA